jgi:hypothetical protein
MLTDNILFSRNELLNRLEYLTHSSAPQTAFLVG